MSEPAAPGGTTPDQQVRERPTEKVKKPDMFLVVLHNDDYTTMEFVVEVLMTVFGKSIPDATIIMLNVHRKGRGHVGVYTYDVAATKVAAVKKMAREREFPLKCTMEKA